MTGERDHVPTDGEYSNLTSVIVSNGYYGSCNQYGTSTTSSSYLVRPLNQVNDKTPLLNVNRSFRPARYINARIFSLGVLFIGGITVGSCLLYLQNYTWPIKLIFDFVSREEWEAKTIPTGRRLFSKNVVYILLQHTATDNCYNFTDCKKFLQDYQTKWQNDENIDIPFNYLIGGDGRVYESRGWSIESAHSPIRSDRSISIALIGNFTENPPSLKQSNGALALITELKYQKKVMEPHRLLGIRYKSNAHHDAEALFSITSKWTHWDEVVTLYT